MKTLEFKNISFHTKLFAKQFIFVLTVVFLTFVGVKYIRDTFLSNSIFSNDEQDIAFSDLFATAYHERHYVHKDNQHVVIIASDGCSRTELANSIEALETMNPKAIGVDYMFDSKSVEDSILTGTFEKYSNIILACDICDFEDGVLKKSLVCSNFSRNKFGCVALDADNVSSKIRTFIPYFYLKHSNDQYIPNFSLALANFIDSTCYKKFNYSEKHLPIRFHGRTTTVFTNDDIQSNQYLKQEISGKIVLIGDTANSGDKHLVPISNLMSGVEIHANTIETILSDDAVDLVSPTFTQYFTFFVLILFVWSMLIINQKLDKLSNGVTRMAQFSLIVLFVYIGYFLYSKEENPLYIDFSWTVLMMGFSTFVFDVVYGIVGIVKYITKNRIFKSGVLLFAFFIGNCMFAQRFSVYSYNKNVTYLAPNSSHWCSIKKAMEVSRDGSVRIPNGASLSIKNKTTGQIYPAKESGEFKIKEIIIDSQKSSISWFEEITRQLFDIGKTIQVLGFHPTGGIRKGSNDYIYEDSLAMFTRQCIKNNSFAKIHTSEDIYADRVKGKNKEFYFSVTNASQQSMYFNIAIYDKKSLEFLGFAFSIINGRNWATICIPSGVTLRLDNFIFSNDKSKGYLLICTDKEFSLDPFVDFITGDADTNTNNFDFSSSHFRLGRIKH